MKYRIFAATAAIAFSAQIFAQPPGGQPGMGQPGMGQPGMGRPGMGRPQAPDEELPREVVETLTYHQGYRLATNIQQAAPEAEREPIFNGLRSVLSGEQPNEEMIAYFQSPFFQGSQMAQQAAQQGMDAGEVLQGISDALADFPARHEEEEVEAAMQTLQTYMMTMQQAMQAGQQPDAEPPEAELRIISYQQGRELAGQVAAGLEDAETARFVEGFQAAIDDELDPARQGYFQGYQIGGQLLQQGADPDKLIQAITDVLEGNAPAYSEEQVQSAMETLQQMQQQQQAQQQQSQQRQMQAMQDQAEQNQAAGEAFLRENAARDEVVTTLSGLQYEVLEEGDGDKPEAEDIVTVHYTGRLLDGTVFDSSVERGEPTEFPLNRVIPGWTEGLQLMSPGAKYRFWIPANLAYGMQAPPAIGPNQVLDFEVELIKVGE